MIGLDRCAPALSVSLMPLILRQIVSVHTRLSPLDFTKMFIRGYTATVSALMPSAIMRWSSASNTRGRLKARLLDSMAPGLRRSSRRQARSR